MPLTNQTATGGYPLVGASKKDLTAGQATTFVKIGCTSGSTSATDCYVAGYVNYTIFAGDGTDFQARSGILNFVVVNKAGTLTMLGFRPDGGTTIDNTTDGVAASSGTLTNTFTIADATGGIFNILANAASSLTETSLFIVYNVVISRGSARVMPQ